MKPFIDVFVVTNFLGAAQGYFLSVVYFFKTNDRKLSNRFIALLLFLTSNSLFAYVLLYSRYALEFPAFNTYKNMIGGLFGPALYLYIRSFTSHNFRLKWIYLLFLIPVIYNIINMLPIISMPHSDQIERLRYFYTHELVRSQYDINGFSGLFYFLIPNGILFIYFSISLKHLKRYQGLLKNRFSFLKTVSINWLTYCFYLMILMWLIDCSFYIYGYMYGGVNKTFMLNLTLVNSIIIYFIAYRNYTQPNKEEIFYIELNEPSLLSKTKLSGIKEVLLHAMEEHQPYLNSKLTLKDLSQIVSIAPRNVSETLNNQLNTNFYDFINSYRVEEIKKRLCNDLYKNYTIQAIAMDCGFHSKSAFTTSFKKFTNMTPSQFRDKNLI